MAFRVSVAPRSRHPSLTSWRRLTGMALALAATGVMGAGVMTGGAHASEATTLLPLLKPVPAIAADPVPDSRHPARMDVLHIPTPSGKRDDKMINAIAYLASGEGSHPTLVILHGLPGNEKNLDLAQAVRRAGWNAITFNYRGSWGSPGSFRFAQNPEDAAAVLAYLRDPAHAKALGVDTTRIALAGHSMGGWATAQTAARDQHLMGAALISAADFGILAGMPRRDLIKLMADNHETLANATPESMADEVSHHKDTFALRPLAPALAKVPLLVLTADDGLAPQADGLVAAIKTQGGTKVTTLHVATDHGWNDHRITLETVVINWLGTLTPTAD